MLQLLTAKPVLYVCNVNEEDAAKGNNFSDKIKQKAEAENNKVVIISAAIEAEIAQLATEEEKLEFLSSLGLKETGLSQVIKQG
jgi:ribosome-binding ATPase YchF (GTP1/OBG family)